MIRNIIFDWSGTLVDDLSAVWRSTNFTLENADRPPLSLKEFRAEFCLPFNEFYEREKEWRKKGGKFIVPIPEFRVVS